MTKNKNNNIGFTSSKSKWTSIAIMSFIAMVVVILLTYASVFAWTNYYKSNFDANPKSIKGEIWAEHKLFTTDVKDDWSWGTVIASYKALFFTSISIALVALFVVGSWLRGASWINKTNTYVSGKTYVRNAEQRLVFRTLAIVCSLVMLWSAGMEIFHDIVDKMKGDPEAVLSKTWEYILSPGNWYFQCFLSSIFIPIALIRRKYNWMLVLLPVAVLGAARTFIDVKEDWGKNAVSTSVSFHRFMMIHSVIIIFPLFFAFANRNRYDLLTIKRAIQYTFLMVLVAYLIFNTIIVVKWADQTPNRKPVDLDWYGELGGAGILLGKDVDWINEHSNLYFWLILTPFGFGIIALFAVASNITHYAIEYKGEMFKKWWQTVKEKEWPILLDSMYTSKRFFNLVSKETKVKINKQYKYIPFGLELPKGIKNQTTI